jgi:hypothetical protein
MAEVPTPNARAPFRVQAGADTWPVHHPCAEDGGPDPLRSPAHPISNRGPPPWRFHLPWRRTENSNPSAFRRPSVFQAEPAQPVHPPRAESGRLERHGVTRASVSSGARPLAGSLSIGAADGDRRTARYAQTGAARGLPASLRAPGGSRTLTSEDIRS